MYNKSVTTAKKKNSLKFSFIIPAAGLGKRMKSLGPKSLIEIGGRSLIEHQLYWINHYYPGAKVVVVGGFEANKLFNALPSNILKIENERYEETNVARSIGLGLRVTEDDPVCIIYGDLYLNKWALSNQINRSTLVLDRENGAMKDEEVGCTFSKRAEHLSFDLPNKWGQIAYFTDNELKLLKRACWNIEKYSLYGFEIINEIITKKGEFDIYTNKNIVITDIDTQKDIEVANSLCV